MTHLAKKNKCKLLSKDKNEDKIREQNYYYNVLLTAIDVAMLLHHYHVKKINRKGLVIEVKTWVDKKNTLQQITSFWLTVELFSQFQSYTPHN